MRCSGSPDMVHGLVLQVHRRAARRRATAQERPNAARRIASPPARSRCRCLRAGRQALRGADLRRLACLSPTCSPQGPLPPSPSFAILPDAPPNPICGPMSPDIAALQPGEPCPFPLHPFLTCMCVRSRCIPSSHACGRRDAQQ